MMKVTTKAQSSSGSEVVSKFKVGEYCVAYYLDSQIYATGIKIKGLITNVKPGLVEINSSSWFHEKQCRLLKKKKRRCIWVDSHSININLKNSGIANAVIFESEKDNCIKFIECKKEGK